MRNQTINISNHQPVNSDENREIFRAACMVKRKRNYEYYENIDMIIITLFMSKNFDQSLL
jgi:hypothetical protein